MEISEFVLFRRSLSGGRKVRARALLGVFVLVAMDAVPLWRGAAAAEERVSVRVSVDAELTASQRQVSIAKEYLAEKNMRASADPADRLRDARRYLALGDPERAAILVFDVVEHRPDHAAYEEALDVYGIALDQMHDKEGAFAATKRYVARYGKDASVDADRRGRAAVRLIHLAFDTHRTEALDEMLAAVEASSPEVRSALSYQKGRLGYKRLLDTFTTQEAVDAAAPPSSSTESTVPASGTRTKVRDGTQVDWSSVEGFFSAVPEGTFFYPHALYFLGVIEVQKIDGSKQETGGSRRFDPALARFEACSKLAVTHPDQRRIHDLSLIAMGRLFYEKGQGEKAVEAYRKVNPEHPDGDVALLEIAWAYMQLGNVDRVEQSLENLVLLRPDSPRVVEGKILLGNLLLRLGRLRKAERVFSEVVDEHKETLDALLALQAKHDDLSVYFSGQVEQALKEDKRSIDTLPEAVRTWFPADEEFRRTEALLGDLEGVQTSLVQLERFISVTREALSSDARIRAFAGLRVAMESVLGARNRLTRAAGMVAEASSGKDEARVQLDQRVGMMPVMEEDFRRRDALMEEHFAAVGGLLAVAEAAVKSMEARLAATMSMVGGMQRASSQEKEALRLQLQAQSEQIEGFRASIRLHRDALDRLRTHAGVGDFRYQGDATVRTQYFSRVEATVKRSGDAGMQRSFMEIKRKDAEAAKVQGEIEARLVQEVAKVEALLREEHAKLAVYRQAADRFRVQVGEVAGQVLAARFVEGLGKYRDMMLRAELGSADVAWAEREQHRVYLEILSRARANRIRSVEDTYREALGEEEEAGGETP